MTVLAASDITVTLNPQDIDFLAYNKVVMPENCLRGWCQNHSGWRYPFARTGQLRLA